MKSEPLSFRYLLFPINYQLSTLFLKGNPMNTLTEFYGEPISVYTDADALQDGVLID